MQSKVLCSSLEENSFKEGSCKPFNLLPTFLLPAVWSGQPCGLGADLENENPIRILEQQDSKGLGKKETSK
jgi:hypothetical protein